MFDSEYVDHVHDLPRYYRAKGLCSGQECDKFNVPVSHPATMSVPLTASAVPAHGVCTPDVRTERTVAVDDEMSADNH